MTVSQYSSTLQGFASAMKAVDPTIRIGAVSSPNPAVAGWNQSLVQSAAHSIDFIAVHDAYAPTFLNSHSVKGASVYQVYQAMMAFPLVVASNMHNLESQVVQNASATDASRIRFAVTEWGPLFSQSTKSNWYDHTRTLGSALFVASTLETFIRDPKIDVASFFKFADPLNMGLKSDAGIAKASGVVFQLFTQHFGNTLVSSTVQSATYNSVATGNIPAMSSVPYLDVISSLSVDSNTLYLIVVNKNLTAAMQTQIALGGFVPATTANVLTIAAPAIDANNGVDIDTALAAQMGVHLVPQIAAPAPSMLATGAPATVAIKKSTQSGIAASFTSNFPPMSVTAIEIKRAG
jgi:alpha-N-arabinofuranosidase